MIHLEYDPKKSKEVGHPISKLVIDFHCSAQAKSEINALITGLIMNEDHGVEFLGYIATAFNDISKVLEGALKNDKNDSCN